MKHIMMTCFIGTTKKEADIRDDVNINVLGIMDTILSAKTLIYVPRSTWQLN